MSIEKSALKIVKTLTEAGYTAYYAGGWVRDYLLDHPSDDIDIATDAKPEVIVDLFPKTIQVGISFGVVVVLMDGHQFEVATFREDLGYEDGRRPTSCAYTNAEGDAKRRDFTINGMFFDPLKGEVIDFVDGRKDLEKEIVRAIGNPHERFHEDRLRMIRAIRFTYRFGYELDQVTEQAIKDHAHSLFPAVAMERVWHELQKMARYPSFDQALIKMHEVGLLAEIFPPLKALTREELEARVSVLKMFPQNCPPILSVLELFPDSSVDELMAFCFYLKVSNKEIKLVEYADKVRQMTNGQDADWARLYAHPDADVVFAVVCARQNGKQLQAHRERMQKLHIHVERIAKKTPVVSAAVLQAEGVVPGKRMGELLREAERLSIAHDLHQPEQVLPLLKQTEAWSLQ